MTELATIHVWPPLERPVLAVGPEGGCSDAERELVAARVSLGDAVLRTETAVVAAVAIVKAGG